MQFFGRMQQFVDQENKTITIKEGYKHFQNYNIAKNLSEHTIGYYEMCFDTFSKFYDVAKPCFSIVENTIFEYIAHLKATRNINDITLNTNLRGMRAMLYYFMKQGYTHPFQISMVRAVKKVKETYTDYELSILLEKPQANKTTFAEYRNWVLINYFLGTGNRISTVCNIKIGDINFQSGTIRLCRTKNKREQIIPLSNSLAKVLKEYFRYRKGGADDYLFCTVTGEKFTENAIRLAIGKYNKKRGVNKTSVHLFRHTFAKKWILNGGDIFRLQKILGHSSLDVVKEYVNMFSDDLKRDFDNFNPLEEFHEQSGLTRKKSKFKKNEFRKAVDF